MNKAHPNSIFLHMFLVWAVISLACGSSAPKDEPNPTEAPKISTATSEPAADQALVDTPTVEALPEAVYLGDAVQNYGYGISAVSVADPATPGILYEAETGKKLVAVEVIISNISGEVLSINPLYANLLDSEGFVYEPELGGADSQLNTMDLFPGEQVRDWISFKIPENATAANIKYMTEPFGSNFLQASLMPPPADHQQSTVSLTPNTQPSKLGDIVEQYGYSISATNVEDPAAPSIIYEPKQGQKLVAVEVVLGNNSGVEPLSVNPLNSYLVDSNGFVYGAELGGRDDQIAVMDLNVGEKIKGWISYTIPEGAVPASVKYQTEYFMSNYLTAGLSH